MRKLNRHKNTIVFSFTVTPLLIFTARNGYLELVTLINATILKALKKVKVLWQTYSFKTNTFLNIASRHQTSKSNNIFFSLSIKKKRQCAPGDCCWQPPPLFCSSTKPPTRRVWLGIWWCPAPETQGGETWSKWTRPPRAHRPHTR